ncbi:MAG: hypothetical protein H7Y86_01885 [Rhizobacter sp.]|nr:hypothetical protein [Ferruginibacter sp.]
MKIFNFLFLLSSGLFLTGCLSEKKAGETGIAVIPAFYHWKTEFTPTKTEWNIVRQNNVKEIYLRFFDVSWDNTFSKPAPIAQVRIPAKDIFTKEKIRVIPTVFITNECIKNISIDQCDSLAKNIYKLINDIIAVNDIGSVNEIQIDCDWTASTKEKYFSLLQTLQKIDTLHLYSATIRLFQVKYKKDAGIPPVKKGLLMCYNMGSLKNPVTQNSILNNADLENYVEGLNAYPLPLDVALPLFSWHVLFRKNEYKGLLQEINNDELKAVSKQPGKNRFEILGDTLWNNVPLKKGDVLRFENSSYKNIMEAAAILKKKLHNKTFRLSLYHLDSIILSKYSTHEIENIFNSLY